MKVAEAVEHMTQADRVLQTAVLESLLADPAHAAKETDVFERVTAFEQQVLADADDPDRTPWRWSSEGVE